MKIEIVKFKDGTYGVRRWDTFWRHYEFFDGDMWVSNKSNIIKYCHFKEKDVHKIAELSKNYGDVGEPI